MRNLEEYFENNQASISEVLELDLSGEYAVKELIDSLDDFFSRYWYSTFNFLFSDPDGELIKVTLKAENGYEGDVKLYYENRFVSIIDNTEDALIKIEKLVINKTKKL